MDPCRGEALAKCLVASAQRLEAQTCRRVVRAKRVSRRQSQHVELRNQRLLVHCRGVATAPRVRRGQGPLPENVAARESIVLARRSFERGREERRALLRKQDIIQRHDGA